MSKTNQDSWIARLTPLKRFVFFFPEHYRKSKCAHTNSHFFCPLHKSTNVNYGTTGVKVCSLCVSCPWGNILNASVFSAQTSWDFHLSSECLQYPQGTGRWLVQHETDWPIQPHPLGPKNTLRPPPPPAPQHTQISVQHIGWTCTVDRVASVFLNLWI